MFTYLKDDDIGTTTVIYDVIMPCPALGTKRCCDPSVYPSVYLFVPCSA